MSAASARSRTWLSLGGKGNKSPKKSSRSLHESSQRSMVELEASAVDDGDTDEDAPVVYRIASASEDELSSKAQQQQQQQQKQEPIQDLQMTIGIMKKDIARLVDEKAKLEIDFLNQMTQLCVANEKLRAEIEKLKKSDAAGAQQQQNRRGGKKSAKRKSHKNNSNVVSSCLMDSISDLRNFVEENVDLFGDQSPRANTLLSKLDQELTGVRVRGLVLEPRHIQPTHEEKMAAMFAPPPPTARSTRGGILSIVSSATYPANDPSEDRSTVVIGDGFIFAAVLDGHGGTEASIYTQKHVFANFRQAFEGGATVPEAFAMACQKTDEDYLQHARALNNPQVLFAGTCLVACYVNTKTGKISCANLGDSRAVMGVFSAGSDEQPDEQPATLRTVPLSSDHTAASALERQRLRTLHKNDPDVVMNMSNDEDDPDWRVKRIAAFTRSIGDTQLKDRASAALYNSYLPPSSRIFPRPGVKATKNAFSKTAPYLSNEPEVKEEDIGAAGGDGFIILACDGVWDEMTNDEAVNIVAELFVYHEGNAEANIAELFIEETLSMALERIAETYDGAENMTLQQLKECPQGKATDWSRSILHDDITVVILRFGTGSGFKSFDASISAESMLSLPLENGDRKRGNRGLSRRGSVGTGKMHSSMSDMFFVVSDEVQKQKEDALRQTTNKQIMTVMELFEGMNPVQLKMVFHALDLDGNGTLDREEIGRLMSQVLKSDVTDLTVDTFFSEMDTDGSGDVDFNEFTAFFGFSPHDDA